MNETVTLQTLLIAVAPIGLLTLISLFAIVGSGAFAEARRRVFGQSTRMRDLEQRVATLESALKRARAAELPLEIEAARLAEEINLLESEHRDTAKQTNAPATPTAAKVAAPTSLPAETTSVADGAADPTPEELDIDEPAAADEPPDLEIELPPDPDETEEDRIAREQLEAEERERIAQLAAEEARIREEREAAERAERERLEAEAKRRHEEEQQRKAEEFRRRVVDATPKIVLSAGGSNREAVTVNVEVTNNLTPKHAEIAVLSSSWAQTPAPATFETQRKDGLYEERWPKHAKDGPSPAWGVYEDAQGRKFESPEDPPTDEAAWIVISYDRTAGGPASTWQQFEVGGAGALWYVRQSIGDPIVVEAQREPDEAAA